MPIGFVDLFRPGKSVIVNLRFISHITTCNGFSFLLKILWFSFRVECRFDPEASEMSSRIAAISRSRAASREGTPTHSRAVSRVPSSEELNEGRVIINPVQEALHSHPLGTPQNTSRNPSRRPRLVQALIMFIESGYSWQSCVGFDLKKINKNSLSGNTSVLSGIQKDTNLMYLVVDNVCFHIPAELPHQYFVWVWPYLIFDIHQWLPQPEWSKPSLGRLLK